MPYNTKTISDTVPVDIVVSNILVATAFNSKSHKLSIYHVSSCERNPLTYKCIA